MVKYNREDRAGMACFLNASLIKDCLIMKQLNKKSLLIAGFMLKKNKDFYMSFAYFFLKEQKKQGPPVCLLRNLFLV